MVLAVRLGRLRLEVGSSPSTADLLDRLHLIIVTWIEERTLGLIRVLVGESGVQHFGVLRAKGQGQTVSDGVEEDIVAEHMALNRLEEGQTATFQAFEQICAAESDEPLARPRQVIDLPLLLLARRSLRLFQQVVAEAVVRRTFASGILSWGSLGIALTLNTQGIHTCKGKKWPKMSSMAGERRGGA